MDKKNLTVSVLVPAYNAESTIKECVESVVKISALTLDLIVTDDGSTDNTLAALNELQEKYAFRVIAQENSGQAASRNRMMAKAKGDYILFCDADDYVDAHKVEKMVEYADANRLELCMGTNFEVDPTTGEVRIVEKANRVEAMNAISICEGKDYLPLARRNKVYSATTPSHLWSKNFIERLGLKYLEGVRYEDVDFTFKSLLHSKRVAFLDSQHYYYVQHGNSSMRAENGHLRPADLKSHAAVVENLMSEIEKLDKVNSSLNAAFFKLVFMDYLATALSTEEYIIEKDANIRTFKTLVRKSGIAWGEKIRIWRKFGFKVYKHLT
ncbi:putative Glycosyltransferase involved in cell wall biogenesis [Vibrio nigripulchritudo SFn27]|uniref:Putative Glycosyltransferase involved in cell wall biogenesis n=1 Tax=Vibrio nigripulchritudo TaxID=28173 RepID=U4K312_9VIBR|nr:glycosyltransferase [Vibrio nigripulchritudo]CCN80365.1 putative Glycosyltransferase involved in cell wall biogenesis [Vibrio nigripulchritudo BLFn1]CCN91289.1 putative Glycosyltransferase involved in cell wall biogenesis [Vibrio nigripulchritudo SFn27]CCN92626.1 putative Glycosyltransferase involved in cell wall biogenesis [Vibrio nigripulchritudo ENn2]CCO41030.1 putative Glycosyltransferase involved in cell wall biogenesis [Vibrio nigripulchritudo SFn135]CCO50575.1 putative Glycosyltransf